MNIQQNVSLKAYSTMRLGGNAAYFAEIHDRSEIPQAVAWAKQNSLPIRMIGTGSNIIWNDSGFPGLLLVNKLQGIEIAGEYDNGQYITTASGTNWDEFVAKTTEMGLTGIEYLSLIPGTVGATPVQNVGAYGAEVSSTIVTIEAFDTQTDSFVNLRGSECDFGYRSSRFKTHDSERFIITSVTFLLQRGNPRPPFYGSLETYLAEHNVQDITPAAVRQGVIAIRSAKLPDPKEIANNGSFFANPIIDAGSFTQLLADYPTIAHWNIGDKVKISAAWLIEQAGFKDYHDPETGMATWSLQPLVLVNEHAETTEQLIAFRDKIITTVSQKFGITLQQEPEII